MQVISKFNKGFRFLLRVMYIFSKYAWVVPLKDKKGVTSMVYKFFDKRSKGGSGVANNEIKQNRRSLDVATLQLAKELHKPIIKKSRKRAVYSRS